MQRPRSFSSSRCYWCLLMINAIIGCSGSAGQRTIVFTLNLSISIWLMSSDWGRDLSATRLRRAGGLSVSSWASVSWDSELSPPPIIPPPPPPVNAPPDTIYIVHNLLGYSSCLEETSFDRDPSIGMIVCRESI